MFAYYFLRPSSQNEPLAIHKIFNSDEKYPDLAHGSYFNNFSIFSSTVFSITKKPPLEAPNSPSAMNFTGKPVSFRYLKCFFASFSSLS